MADGERKYRVLILVPNDPSGEREGEEALGGPRRLTDTGAWPGSTPDEAIEAAVSEFGMPREDQGRAVAIPESKWHERDVGKRMEPVFEVTPVAADPVEDPPAGVGG